MADFQIDLELITKQFDASLSKTVSATNKFSDKVDKNFDKVNKSIGGASSALGSFIGNLGANAIASFVGGLGSFASGIIESTKALEVMSTELGVMLGSAEAGQKQLEQLQQFAASTPFQLPGIVDATKKLLAFGTKAEDLQDVLNTLGDVAAGSGKDFASLATIYGQVQAETKLSLERFNQLNDAGVSLGQTIADKLNIPLVQVRKEIGKGKVSFDLFKDSLDDITDDGGLFADAMIKKSETLSGVLSTLSDNVFNLSGKIGSELLPIIKEGALAFIGFTKFIGNNLTVIKDSFIALTALAVGYGTYALSVNGAAIATTAFNLVLSLNPFVLAATALLALGVAIKTYSDRTGDATKASNDFKVGIANLADLQLQLNKAIQRGSSPRILQGIQARIDAQKEEIKVAKELKDVKSPEDLKAIEAAAKVAEDAKAAKKLADDEKLEAERAFKELLKAEELIFLDEMKIIKDEAKTAEEEAASGNSLKVLKERADLEKRKIKLQKDTNKVLISLEVDKEKKKKLVTDLSRKQELSALKSQIKKKLEFQKQESEITKKIKEDQYQATKSFAQTNTSDILNILSIGGKEGLIISKGIALAFIAIEDSKARAVAQVTALAAGPAAYALVLAKLNASISATTGLAVASVGIGLASGLKDIDKAIDTKNEREREEKERLDLRNLEESESLNLKKIEDDRDNRISSGTANAEDIAFAQEQARISRFEDTNRNSFNDNINRSIDLDSIADTGRSLISKSDASQLSSQSSSDTGARLTTAISSLGDRISSIEIVLVADDNEIARSASRGVESGIVIGRS
jgi:tape measure domain-containing protein